MGIVKITSRQLNQETSKIQKVANENIVFITVRGQPKQVMLSFDEYKKLTEAQQSIVDLIGLDEDIEFEPPKLTSNFTKPTDFD